MAGESYAPKAGKIENVSFYGSRQQEGHISAIWNLIERLLGAGITVSVEKKLADVFSDAGYRLAVHGIKTCTKVPDETQMAISVGGDGTFLRTARWLAGREIPILGINTGHLGFLAENSSANVDETVALITLGHYAIERRLLLESECTLPADAKSATSPAANPYALNEVALLKGAASMIDIDVTVDGFHLATYRADGLLAATPTGSTAYNLSVGGPILAPTLRNITLSPIAPHTLTLRPVVVSADSEIKARVTSRASEFRLSIDGHSVALPCGTIVTIRQAPHSVLTVRRPDENFASTLRSKLLWGH